MWPFPTRIDRPEDEIANLRLALDDAYEREAALSQQLGEWKSAVQAMQRALTESGLTEIANRATAQIADIYASGGHNGVRGRDLQVNCVIRRAVRLASRGVTVWDEGRRAVAGYEETTK